MSTHRPPSFARWEADDVLEAIHASRLPLERVGPAIWPSDAPQPRTHRQAVTFLSPGTQDPHLLLVFDTPDGMAAWHGWLARYWKARPYVAVKDNVLLLVSRELPLRQAQLYHAALDRLGP